ncbi:hypothetical protein B0H17DRAFT_1145733 [Mycena rosella]|uniref:Uncharacterized protein n=1 Tax=Mycena rosella TaxID=1033263 RepID=A0AAD7G5K0_MYCRO|nr:hypothetical protein B0H17DRAFT_1145733 [Mycena rosella]
MSKRGLENGCKSGTTRMVLFSSSGYLQNRHAVVVWIVFAGAGGEVGSNFDLSLLTTDMSPTLDVLHANADTVPNPDGINGVDTLRQPGRKEPSLVEIEAEAYICIIRAGLVVASESLYWT